MNNHYVHNYQTQYTSEYDLQVEAAVERLNALGVDITSIGDDYFKVPIENTDLSQIEREHPKRAKVVSQHNIVIDSRERNYTLYPTPSSYLMELSECHRNVEKLELLSALLPKTEYNITSENNLLLTTVNGVQVPLYLTPGQYTLGSNVNGSNQYTSNGITPTYGILSEVIRVLNTHPMASGGFTAFLATLPKNSGGTGINASVLNRVVITHSSLAFSIDMTTANFTAGSPYRVLGFLKTIYNSGYLNMYGSSPNGTCTSADLQSARQITLDNAISASYDYNLADEPNYIILELQFGNKTADRVESNAITLNQKFAVVIYDANEPDNLATYNGSDASGCVVLAYERKPGRLKALKGTDFDKKTLEFDPPITLESIMVSFTKYDGTPYNFNNREHMLSFQLDVADYDPRYRY